MKKLILALIFSSAQNVFAQQESGTFTIQPKVGLNVANVTGESTKNINGVSIQRSPRIGLVAGLEFEYQFTKMFGLSFGALYSMQGAKAKAVAQGVTITETDKIDYINVPIMANVYVVKGVALRFGFQPAFKVHDGYKLSAQGQSLSGNMSDFYNLNSFDFSIPVGLGFEFSNVVID